MKAEFVPFTDLLLSIVDNRGRTCPTVEDGIPLIATNCVGNDSLYPTFSKIRFVDRDTYENWFRGHPEPGDILFVCKGSPGRVCLVPDPVGFCIAQDMVAVRPDPALVHTRYLLHALRSLAVQEQIKNMHVGTLIPHFKKADFKHLMIPLPPLDVQGQIGDFLGALDDKIDVNQRIAAGADQMAVAEYKLAVSQGEQAVALSHVAALTMGSSPPGSTYNEVGEGLPFFQGTRDFGFRYPSRRVYCTEPKRLAEPNDTLVSVRAPVGRLNVAVERCVIGRGVAAARGEYPSCLFHALQASADAWEPYESEGTVFGSINGKALRSLPLRWPSVEPEGLEAILAPLDAVVVQLLRENARLSELRDALLPKLLSGELRVGEAEGELEEAGL